MRVCAYGVCVFGGCVNSLRNVGGCDLNAYCQFYFTMRSIRIRTDGLTVYVLQVGK